jgi:general secretion pathway protein C
MHGNHGAALIAVDGKPPKPVRVGAALDGVEGGWKLQSLAPRAAVLATDGHQQARLEMPRLSSATPATSASPSAVTP